MITMQHRLIKKQRIKAVQFDGTSTHANAIEQWLKSGSYTKPSISTRDIRTVDINHHKLSGTRVLTPNDYMVLYPSGVFSIHTANYIEKAYEPVTSL